MSWLATSLLHNEDTFEGNYPFVRFEMDLIGRIHDRLSLHVLTPLSRLQRSTRPATRRTQQAFNEGLRFRRETINWTHEQRLRWIEQRLRTTVRRAYEETVYYRELLDRIKFDVYADFSFEEFSRIPVLTREDVREFAPELLASSVPPSQRYKESTGGSTGVPTELWMGPNERGWRGSGMEHFFERLGIPEGSRTAFLWGHHLDPKATDSFRDRYRAFVANIRWFDSMRLSPAILEEYHQELERFRPACIIAYASALGHLAEHVLSRNYKPSYPTRCMITGAEKLWARHRRLIEKAFNRPVHERYGSRDAGCLGVQMNPNSMDFTIDWSQALVEPELPQPESPILITKLQADAMPMIRYRIGDVGRFPDGSQPGYPVSVLHEIVGRESARLWMPDGRWVMSAEVPHLLKDYPVKEFMCVQRADYSVQLRIVPRNGFSEEDKQTILDTIGVNLPGLDLSVVIVDEIPRTVANKWQPVISEVTGHG
jgi:phenylacetate-CoA ligase